MRLIYIYIYDPLFLTIYRWQEAHELGVELSAYFQFCHGSLCAGGAGFACPRWRSSDLLRSRRSLEPHRIVTCIPILET